MAAKKTKSGTKVSKNRDGEQVYDLRNSQDLLKDMNRAIIAETNESGSSVGAVRWFTEAIRTGQMILPDETELTTDLLRSKERLTSKAFMHMPGRMFTFMYQPKTKPDLKYYDITPLVITLPVMGEQTTDNILGINLHYLEPELRAELIDRLLKIANSRKGENLPPKGVGYFRVNYELLKTKRFVFGMPCIRRYDLGRIIGRPVLIPANEWGNAVALPFDNFVKKNESPIWLESRRLIRKFIQSIGSGGENIK
jgi:hypothetical protein